MYFLQLSRGTVTESDFYCRLTPNCSLPGHAHSCARCQCDRKGDVSDQGHDVSRGPWENTPLLAVALSLCWRGGVKHGGVKAQLLRFL